MISKQDKTTIIELATRYKVKRLLVFGSSASLAKTAKDIDLAVEGISPSDFFNFYGDLLFNLSKPVDLIDLTKDNKFTRLIRKEGLPLYG